MKRLFTIRGIFYIVYTLVFFAVVFYMDSIPNHSDGTSDYRTWLVWLYLPVLFVYHGLMSKVILRGYKFYIPLAVTAVFGFIEVLLGNSNIAVLVFDRLENSSTVISALAVTAYYLAFTALGILIMNTLRLLYLAVGTLYHCFKDTRS